MKKALESSDLNPNVLITNEILKNIFTTLTWGKDALDSKDALKFFSELQKKYKDTINQNISYEEYKNESEALITYSQPKIVSKDRVEYIEKYLNNSKYNYYQFQKGFLILIDSSELYKLDTNLAFTQITTRPVGLFSKKVLNKRNFKSQKNILGNVQDNLDTVSHVTESKEFELPKQKGLRFHIFTLILMKLTPKESLNMGLVSKEFLQISRNDTLWKYYTHKYYLSNLETQ